ncbi:hypothetical protein KIPB_005101 [Kipferlia bialata]|uniref:Uncharacterized protein n=1 Tax=Kipferlia bialata TaxID=797122 RepID=A0A9K3CW54_9EUKA|nr:hypothetical protein KIPB_005101 [Kipferlia bialata]|eukprot:g5101.t1
MGFIVNSLAPSVEAWSRVQEILTQQGLKYLVYKVPGTLTSDPTDQTQHVERCLELFQPHTNSSCDGVGLLLCSIGGDLVEDVCEQVAIHVCQHPASFWASGPESRPSTPASWVSIHTSDGNTGDVPAKAAKKRSVRPIKSIYDVHLVPDIEDLAFSANSAASAALMYSYAEDRSPIGDVLARECLQLAEEWIPELRGETELMESELEESSDLADSEELDLQARYWLLTAIVMCQDIVDGHV